LKSIINDYISGHVEVRKGEWLRGRNAGGSRNDLVNFAMNPQFVLSLTEPGISICYLYSILVSS